MKFIFIIILAVSISYSENEYYTLKLNSDTEKYFNSGINCLMKSEYSEAIKQFENIKLNSPNNPLGYLLIAICLQTRNEDYFKLENLEIIKFHLEKSSELSESMLKNSNAEKEGLYYYSLSQALKCLHKLSHGDKIEAVSNGFKAYFSYSKSVKKYPNFLEPLSGYSAAIYWQAKRFPLLSGFNVEKQKLDGITGLKKVYENSRIEKYFALHYLIWILIDEHKYEDALKIISENQINFPSNRFYLRAKLTIYNRLNDKKKILGTSLDFLKSIMESGIRNPHSEILALHNFILHDNSKQNKNEFDFYYKTFPNLKCQKNHNTCITKVIELKKYSESM